MTKPGVVVAVLVLASGCKSRVEKRLDERVESAERNLPEARASIAAGQLDVPCSEMLAARDVLEDRGKTELLAEIEQVCEYDLHMAKLRRAVERAEQVHECRGIQPRYAVEELRRSGRFDGLAEFLVARYRVACPPRHDYELLDL
jgi:hypothetical protein